MKKIFSHLHYVSFLIGLLVLVSLLVEFVPSLPRMARSAYLKSQGVARHELVDHAAYGDAAWRNDYWFEQTHNVKARWEPYVYWRMAETSGKYVNVDALGRRTTVQSPAGENSFLIHIFGGSTMWGLGVPDAHTIPSELAALIKGRNVEIVNYGEQGFVTTQSYMQLLLNLRRGERPNLVVFYDGYNDLLVPTFGSKAGLPHNEARRVTEFKLSLKEERFRTYLQALKFAYGRSLSWAESAGRSINPAAPVKLSTVEIWRAGKEVIDAYAFNLDLVRDLGRSFGFKPLFFLQPIRGVDPAKPPAPGEAASIFQAGYHVAHQRFPASRDVIFLDEVLKGGPNVYLDDAHLSHLGNRTVAREMLNSIEPLLP